MTPAGTSNELDVQHEREDNTTQGQYAERVNHHQQQQQELGIFIFVLFFSEEKKIPVTGIRFHVPTCQKVTRLPTELPGRPAVEKCIFPCPRSRLRIWSRVAARRPSGLPVVGKLQIC